MKPESGRQFTEFLVKLEIDEIPDTQKNYLGTWSEVYNLMQSAGCDEELRRAGLFHSIYGTDRRSELAELIGSEPSDWRTGTA